MANSYLQYSVEIKLPQGKTARAKEIIKSEINKPITEESGWESFEDEWEISGNSLYFWAEENGNTDALEAIVRLLVEALDLRDPVIVSWAYTCSKPRPDEFGGGAFAVAKGKKTIWIDAVTEAWKRLG